MLNAKVIMPTIFIVFGFRFMFYANDHTPIHVHIIKDGNSAKYNIYPIELIENKGFKRQELRLIEAIIEENEDTIAQHWDTFFNNK